MFGLGRRWALASGAAFPAKEITTELEWSDLVLAADVRQQVQAIEDRIRHHRVVRFKWGMRSIFKAGYRALFCGAPGTGKTLTATLIGRSCDRPVFRVDPAMAVSKDIGETEKNLAAVFDRAERRDWILFFDEADALFGKRTEVRDAHDRYSNMEVSYLLQRVEDHSGLVILATDLGPNIDTAFMRRMDQVVRFPMPDEEQRAELWRMLLPAEAHAVEGVDLADLFAGFELSGGSIRNAIYGACLRAAARSGSPQLTEEDVEIAVRMEFEREGRIFEPIKP